MGHVNDNVIIVMIILVIMLFLKALFYYSHLTKFHNIFISDEDFEKFRNKLSDVLDIFLMIISLFVLFLRKNNSMLIIILAIIFLVKTILHFFVNYNLYKYTSLSESNIDKIQKFYNVESFITNTMLFIASFYMLNIIFINK
jgi:hypothetical protein